MKFKRLTLGLILAASSAYAVNAPDNMALEKVDAGAAIVMLPNATVKWDVRNHPTAYSFHFKGGVAIQPDQALDGTVRSSTDPRLATNSVTCSVFIDNAPGPVMPAAPFTMYVKGKPQPAPAQPAVPTTYNPMPPYIRLNDNPSVATKTDDFDNRPSVTQQQLAIPYSWQDPQSGAINQGQLICYKVGTAAMTVGDIRHALGGATQIQLSAAQTAAMISNNTLRDLLNGADRSITGTSYQGAGVSDGLFPKVITHVTNEQTDGSFQARPLIGQIRAQ